MAAVRLVRTSGVAALAQAATEAAPEDVLVVAEDARVPADVVERLAACAPDPSVATVSALGRPEGDPVRVSGEALRLRPRLLDVAFDCTLVRRAALDLAGPLDEGFARRCQAIGLVHVLADDVLVTGVPETTTSAGYVEVDQAETVPPRPPNRLDRTLTWTRRILDGLEVTLDGRAIKTRRSGTEVQALALIRALQRTGAARVRVLVEDGTQLEDAETLDVGEVLGARRTPIVHRLQQLADEQEVQLLGHVGERLVVTHLDLLLYHDPAYHQDLETWGLYRRMTAAGLAAADFVTAISDHVRDDLLAEDLVEPVRLRRVYLGVDHEDAAGPATAPGGLEAGPFLLSIGNDLAHKNRPFALALVRALRTRGWDGRLVVVGPRVAVGGSAPLPQDDPAVVDLGSVTDAERRWLYREAAAVVYPSTDEGFGLVPFEAARADTPTVFGPIGPLAELIGATTATLVPWDAEASADRVLPVLRDPATSRALTRAIADAGAELTWDRTAQELLAVYDETLRMPGSQARAQAFATLATDRRREHWERQYWLQREQIGPTGLSLVGEDGLLDVDAQRALAALARRPPSRRALLAVLRAAQRVGGGGGR